MPEAVQPYFYHELFVKAIVAFGSRFNDLTIKRKSDDATVDHTVNVPIQYSPIQKDLARLKADEDGGRKFNIILPRIGFELVGIDKAPEKQINFNKNLFTGAYKTYVPVPYNLQFQLNVISDKMEDGLQIVEQIIPLFAKNLSVSAKLLDNLDHLFSLPIVLNSMSLNDTYEGDFLARRVIIWQFDFTMQYFFFGPVPEAKPIKFITVNFYDDAAMSNKMFVQTTRPGLTANGEPTTEANNSVEYTQINVNDNYGFIHEFTEDAD